MEIDFNHPISSHDFDAVKVIDASNKRHHQYGPSIFYMRRTGKKRGGARICWGYPYQKQRSGYYMAKAAHEARDLEQLLMIFKQFITAPAHV